MEAYMAGFVEHVLQTAELLSQDQSVAIVAAPTGGIAPFHAVMEEAMRSKRLKNAPVQFIPYIAGNDAVQQAIRNAQAHLLIDDGLAYMTSQAEYLASVDDPQAARTIFPKLQANKQSHFSCNDEALVDSYQEVMRRFADRQVVLCPLFTKNRQFFDVANRIIAEGNTAWSQAQERFLGFPVRVIDEHRTTPGAMMHDIPCRDVGVTYGYIRDILDPRVQKKFDAAGLGNTTTFRLLANRRDVISFGHEESGQIRQAFVDLLHEKFL